jgi:hypothetical protein
MRAGVGGAAKAITVNANDATSIATRTIIIAFCILPYFVIFVYLPSVDQTKNGRISHSVLHLSPPSSSVSGLGQLLQLLQRVGESSVDDHTFTVYHVEKGRPRHLVVHHRFIVPD